ncbi:MAG: hypothetical protein E2O29_01675 [Deltaproteobacteria bacterium]|nr:MAG: hypothetical protein E2O29_01675 [Deltaproteobacteria bacterium]
MDNSESKNCTLVRNSLSEWWETSIGIGKPINETFSDFVTAHLINCIKCTKYSIAVKRDTLGHIMTMTTDDNFKKLSKRTLINFCWKFTNAADGALHDYDKIIDRMTILLKLFKHSLPEKLEKDMSMNINMDINQLKFVLNEVIDFSNIWEYRNV